MGNFTTRPKRCTPFFGTGYFRVILLFRDIQENVGWNFDELRGARPKHIPRDPTNINKKHSSKKYSQGKYTGEVQVIFEELEMMEVFQSYKGVRLLRQKG